MATPTFPWFSIPDGTMAVSVQMDESFSEIVMDESAISLKVPAKFREIVGVGKTRSLKVAVIVTVESALTNN